MEKGTLKSGHEKKVPQQVSQEVLAEGGSTIKNIQQISGGYHRHYHYNKPLISIPFMAPPLPPYFIPRPEIEKDLKTRILSKSSNPSGVLVVSAIQGIGGIGKSTIAAALMHDRQIQDQFHDGILWTTLGQTPDILAILSGWLQNLGNYDARPATIESASSALRSLLYDKKMILVVDDVWEPSHVLPFLISGSRSRILITTRRIDVADRVGADLHYVDVMTPNQSIKLLEARVGRKFQGKERELATALAQEVGFLPLALDLAAIRAIRGAKWDELRNALHTEVAALEVLENRSEYRKGHLILEASYNLSLNFLRKEDEVAWQAFVWLGVLPEDVTITERMASTLWEQEADEARNILESLWSDGLLLPGIFVNINGIDYRGFRIHDILHDMARRLIIKSHPDGFGIQLSRAHHDLLARYREKSLGGQWHTIPNDGYIHSFLTWHMQSAGEIDSIHELMREETSDKKNGWYTAREILGQTAGYIDDVNRAWMSSTFLDFAKRQNIIADEFRYALINASLVSLAQKIQPALLSALVVKEVWTPSQALAYAFQVKDENQLAEAIEELSFLIPVPLLHQSSIVANRISQEFAKGRALSAISTALVKTGSAEGVDLIKTIVNEKYRDQALANAIPFLLIGNSLALADKLAKRIKSRRYQAEALIAKIPFSNENELVGIYKQISDTLSSLLPRNGLTDNYIDLGIYWVIKLASAGKIKDALFVSEHTIKHPFVSTLAYIEILPYVQSGIEREKTIENILNLLNNVNGEYAKAELKGKLIPYLDSVERKETVLSFLNDIKHWAGIYSKALVARSKNFPEKKRMQELVKALDSVQRIKWPYPRARSVASLAPNLSKEMVRDIFLEMQNILDEDIYHKAILQLFPFLSGAKLNQAISYVSKIKNESFVNDVIIKLPSRTPQDVIKNALSMIESISNKSLKANTILGLIYKMKKEEMDLTSKRWFLDLIENESGWPNYDELVEAVEDAFSQSLPPISPETQSLKDFGNYFALNEFSANQHKLEITVLRLDTLIYLFSSDLIHEYSILDFIITSIYSIDDVSWRVRLLLRIVSIAETYLEETILLRIADEIMSVQNELEKSYYISYLVNKDCLGDVKKDLINTVIEIQKRADFGKWINILSEIYPTANAEQKGLIDQQKAQLARKMKLGNEPGQSALTDSDNDISNDMVRRLNRAQKIGWTPSSRHPSQKFASNQMYFFEQKSYISDEFGELIERVMPNAGNYEVQMSLMLNWLDSIPPHLRSTIELRILLYSLQLNSDSASGFVATLSTRITSEMADHAINYIKSIQSDNEKFRKGIRLIRSLAGKQRNQFLIDLSGWVWSDAEHSTDEEIASSLKTLSEFISDDQADQMALKVFEFIEKVNSVHRFALLPSLMPYLKFASKNQLFLLFSDFFSSFGHEPRSTLLSNLEYIIPICLMLNKNFADDFLDSMHDIFGWWK